MSHTSVTRTALLLGAAFLLTACGAGVNPTAATQRAGQAAAKNATTHKLAALEGPLTANRVLAMAHVVAHEIDAKAAFTGLTGTLIGHDGQPAGKGTWTVQYVGADVTPPAGKNPFANKFTRRIGIEVDAQGIPTVTVSTEPGMPLGVSYLDSPVPELDSTDVMNILRKSTRPAHFPIERMSLSGHPRDYQVMLWKIGTLKQSGDRPITINANTGAIVATPY